MAGERALPGLDLYGFWTLGSNGYRTQHSGNLRILSALTQCRVISRTTSLPGSPTAGDMYIVPTGDADAEAIAIRDYDTDDATAIWVYLTPAEGYMAYVEDDGEYVSFDGAAWGSMIPTASSGASVNAQTGTSYTLVLGDANNAVTMDNASANTLNVPLNSSVAFPVGTVVSIVQLGAGVTTVDGATGVSINGVDGGAADLSAQHGAVSLLKVATDTWNLAGAHEGVA